MGVLTLKGGHSYSQIPSECDEYRGRGRQSLSTGKRLFRMKVD